MNGGWLHITLMYTDERARHTIKCFHFFYKRLPPSASARFFRAHGALYTSTGYMSWLMQDCHCIKRRVLYLQQRQDNFCFAILPVFWGSLSDLAAGTYVFYRPMPPEVKGSLRKQTVAAAVRGCRPNWLRSGAVIMVSKAVHICIWSHVGGMT